LEKSTLAGVQEYGRAHVEGIGQTGWIKCGKGRERVRGGNVQTEERVPGGTSITGMRHGIGKLYYQNSRYQEHWNQNKMEGGSGHCTTSQGSWPTRRSGRVASSWEGHSVQLIPIAATGQLRIQ
jgi:hypothetical protein